MRDFIKLTNPEHIIPSHSEKNGTEQFLNLGKELNYEEGKSMHALTTGSRIKIK